MKRALRIEFDAESGERAGGVDPKDPALEAKGMAWQHLDGVNSYEVRLVKDDRDLSEYSTVAGVEVLEGRDAINAALDALEADEPAQYGYDEEVVLKALEGDNTYPDMDVLEGKRLNDVAGDLHSQNVPGVSKRNISIPRV